MLIAKEQLEISQLITGLYLGCFDPVHNAHVDIPLKTLKYYKLDRIIYIPTGLSPVGKKPYSSNKDRINMLENALSQHQSLYVSDYELKLKNICYTVNTIKYFKKKYPKHMLRLIVGEDNFRLFSKWYKYLEIINLVNIIVLIRDNTMSCDNMETLKDFITNDIDLFNESSSNKIHYFNGYKSNISSTMIRDNIRNGKSVKEYVTADNFKYIVEKNLYK